MAGLRKRTERAFALHRQAVEAAGVASALLTRYTPVSAAAEPHAKQRELAARLRAAASKLALAPGWLDASLDALSPTTPLGCPYLPTFVRVGQAQLLDDTHFPVMLPLLRAGHIAIDSDARDQRVAGLLRSLLLRLIAAAPINSIHVHIIDNAETGATFEPFYANLYPPIITSVVTDHDGLRTLLSEVERGMAHRPDHHSQPSTLLVIASLPELTDGLDLSRIVTLAAQGPAQGLHIIAAGWPPPPLTAETTQRPLPHCTQITIRNPHSWIGDPPGAMFSDDRRKSCGLNAPVFLDPDPPFDLIRRVCEELATMRNAGPVPLGDEPASTVDAWTDYLAAARTLGMVRRQTSAVVSQHEVLWGTAAKELENIGIRLAQQASAMDEAYLVAKSSPSNPNRQKAFSPVEWMALSQPESSLTVINKALHRANMLIEAAYAELTHKKKSLRSKVAIIFFITTTMIILMILAAIVPSI